MRGQLEQMEQDAARMAELAGRLDDPELERLALRMWDTAGALLKE